LGRICSYWVELLIFFISYTEFSKKIFNRLRETLKINLVNPNASDNNN
jgi:hypothetical protein